MIAVMGAAGHVGSKVADLLLRDRQPVRVLAHQRRVDALRERGAEVVEGDARNVDDLKAFFRGADAALVLLPENMGDQEFTATRVGISRVLAEALGHAEVRHVVALSTIGIERAEAAGPVLGLREFEQGLGALHDANVLVLRSAFYMDYLLANLPLIQSQKINGSVVSGDLKIPMIATADVAQEAAEQLTRRDFIGHEAKILVGPEDVTMREATTAIGEMLGISELPYLEFPPADMKGALLGAGMSDEAATLLVDMQIAMNTGWPFDRVERMPASTTPTRLKDFLKTALPATEAARVSRPRRRREGG